RKPAPAVSGVRLVRSDTPAAPAQFSVGVLTASAIPGKLGCARANRSSSWSSRAGSGVTVEAAGAGVAWTVTAAAATSAASASALARRLLGKREPRRRRSFIDSFHRGVMAWMRLGAWYVAFDRLR